MGSAGRKVERFAKGLSAKTAKYSDPANIFGGRDYHDRVYDKRKKKWESNMEADLREQQAKEDAQRQTLTAEDGTKYGQQESSGTLYRPDNIPQGNDMYSRAIRDFYMQYPERGTALEGQTGQAQGPIYDSPAAPEGTPPATPVSNPDLIQVPSNMGLPATGTPAGARDFSGRSGNPFAQAARDAGFTDFQTQPDIRRVPVKTPPVPDGSAPRGNKLWPSDPRNIKRMVNEAATRGVRAQMGQQGFAGKAAEIAAGRAAAQARQNTQSDTQRGRLMDAMRRFAAQRGAMSGGARQMVAPNMTRQMVAPNMARQSATSAALRGGGNNG